MQGPVATNLPVVGARRKPYIGYQCKATDRIFVSSKRPDSLVLLPELDCFVCGAFVSSIS